MATINTNYQKLQAGYLFPEIGKRVRNFAAANPSARIIRLGIGDVVLPLPPPIVDAIKVAADEMGRKDTFRGYGPEQGYDFLLDAVAAHFRSQGAEVAPDEIFVSDGSKCDTANIQEIFAIDNIIAVTDPVYPVYVDTNVMAGRTSAADQNGRYGKLVYLPTNAENGFEPALPSQHVDLIYLCSPNNPTGAVMSRASLQRWVDYAQKESAVILFDAAYEAFIREPGLVLARWPSSFAASRRRRASPARVARSRLFRRSCAPATTRATPSLCMACGIVATPRSSTASATPSSGRPRRRFPPKVARS